MTGKSAAAAGQAINRCLYLNSEHELSLVNGKIPEPGPGEVLVRIEANGICGSDIHFYRAVDWVIF